MMDSPTDTLPSFAVCLAAFNGSRWLDEQIDSILAQVKVRVVLFVSVDKSDDGTETIVDMRRRKDHRVVALEHGQSFGSATRNFFRLLNEVEIENFHYISLSDQDDIWLPDKLIRAHEVLLKTGSHGYSGDVVAFWPSGRRRLVTKSQPQRSADYLFEGGGPGCSYVLRADFAKTLQEAIRLNWAELQPVVFHDWFIYAFARTRGYRWIIDNRPSLLYRQHTGNMVGANHGWQAFRHRVKFILDGRGFEESSLYARILGVSKHPFVARGIHGGRLDRVWLALNARQCRRQRRDQLLFTLSCIVTAVWKQSSPPFQQSNSHT